MKCKNCGHEHDGAYGSGMFCSKHCRFSYMAKQVKNRCVSRPHKPKKPEIWKCCHCGLGFDTRRLLIEHKHKEHPHIKQQAWNKGLTKETNPSLQRAAERLIGRYKRGEIIPSFKGKHHSEESKRKIKQRALESCYQRVCKKTEPYVCVDGSIVNLDSSYERKVAKILDENRIQWIRPEPLPWIDNNGVQHHYFPDFYIPHKNLYLDPKNEYCFVAQAEKISCVMKQYNNVMFLHESDLTKEHILSLVV